jgi:hypothetical protein
VARALGACILAAILADCVRRRTAAALGPGFGGVRIRIHAPEGPPERLFERGRLANEAQRVEGKTAPFGKLLRQGSRPSCSFVS